MKHDLRFVIVPKVAHPWFDEVNRGALMQGESLEQQLGVEVIIDYLPPAVADPAEQNAILNSAAATRPDGIAVDPVDEVSRMESIHRIKAAGIPVILFDSPSPDPDLTSVGNDFTEQGVIAAERLVTLIEASGKVAIMRGVPAAPNHRQRYEAQVAVLKKYPRIVVVDGGVDNDDIATAEQQALAVLAANPDLRGYLCCDASGPIGIAAAITQAGRVGTIKVVGMDGIRPILEAIKRGVLDSSSATIPTVQGSMSVLMLWQAALGMRLPRRVDTGIDIITAANVDAFLASAGRERQPEVRLQEAHVR